jgi:hypothetical protein
LQIRAPLVIITFFFNVFKISPICLLALLLHLLGRDPNSHAHQPQAAGPNMAAIGDLNPAALSSSALPCLQPRPQNTDTPARTHTRSEWNSHKENIRLLYCVKGRKLQEVVELFKRQHDFFATYAKNHYFIHSPEHRVWHSLTSMSAREKQFKDRIRVWGFDKKIKMREMKAIIRKQHFRSLQGKESSFEVRGRPVDQAQYYTPTPTFFSLPPGLCAPAKTYK